MATVWTRVVGTLVACTAVVTWLIDLVTWQSPSEPPPLSRGGYAEDNTYWARDLRWALIAAALIGVVLAVRGARGRSAAAAAVGLVWVFADALLDRLNVGAAFGWWAGPVLVGLIVAVVWAVRAPSRPGRGALMVAAYVGAPTASVAAAMESVHDAERALTIGAVISAGLLVMGALGCALAARPTTRRRCCAALAALIIASGLIVACRAADPGSGSRQTFSLGLVVVMLTAVYVLTNARPRRAMIAGYLGLLYATVAGCIVFSFAMLASTPVARAFTALAANPPVNSSDTDVILSLMGIVPGLVLGALAWKTHNYGLDNPTSRVPLPPTPTLEPVDP